MYYKHTSNQFEDDGTHIVRDIQQSKPEYCVLIYNNNYKTKATYARGTHLSIWKERKLKLD
jgi:hypothetical protein